MTFYAISTVMQNSCPISTDLQLTWRELTINQQNHSRLSQPTRKCQNTPLKYQSYTAAQDSHTALTQIRISRSSARPENGTEETEEDVVVVVDVAAAHTQLHYHYGCVVVVMLLLWNRVCIAGLGMEPPFVCQLHHGTLFHLRFPWRSVAHIPRCRRKER